MILNASLSGSTPEGRSQGVANHWGKRQQARHLRF